MFFFFCLFDFHVVRFVLDICVYIVILGVLSFQYTFLSSCKNFFLSLWFYVYCWVQVLFPFDPYSDSLNFYSFTI